MDQLVKSGRVAEAGTVTRWLRLFLGVPADKIIGCNEAEIARVEAVAGRVLPKAYRQMLSEAGRSMGEGDIGKHFRRCELLFPAVLEVHDVAMDVIRLRRKDEALLDRAFPFFNWDIYCILLLDLSTDDDDPPVLRLNEAKGDVTMAFTSFSHFLLAEIALLADALEVKRQSGEGDENGVRSAL